MTVTDECGHYPGATDMLDFCGCHCAGCADRSKERRSDGYCICPRCGQCAELRAEDGRDWADIQADRSAREAWDEQHSEGG